MTITKKQFRQLMEAAVMGADKCLTGISELEILNLVSDIERSIKSYETVNGCEAERITIIVNAN